MANEAAHLLAKHLLNLSSTARLDHLPDGELLQRFATGRDEDAFAALVRRHGSMVLRVGRRVLHNGHDAEDVFQATFLVLSRKAASLRRSESVGCWLHGVAFRLSLKARMQFARQRRHEGQIPVERRINDPLADLTVREAQAILDEELARLPEKYRSPLILCCLEGNTRDEAARLLGWSAKLVKSRLEQGRERLRYRLSRRGLTLPAALLATLLAEEAAPAALPAVLIRATVQGVRAFPGNGISASVALLAERALSGTATVKGKAAIALLLLSSVLAAGLSIVAPQQPAAQQAEKPSAATAPESPKSEKPQLAHTDRYGDPLPRGAIGRIGTTRFLHGGTVMKVAFAPDGKILAGIGDDKVRLWNAANGKELRRDANEARRFFFHGAFAPNGRRLWVQTYQGKTFFWDFQTEPDSRLRPAPLKGPYARFIAPSPDGNIVAIGDKNIIRFFDIAKCEEVRCLEGHTGQVERAVFSADGKLLASSDGNILLWDVATGRRIRAFHPTVPRQHFTVFALSADGKTVAAATDGRSAPIFLWDAATGNEIRTIPGSDHAPQDLLFSPDGKILALACDPSLRAWEVSSGKQLWEHRSARTHYRSVAFSPDGKTLATGQGGGIRLWNPRTGAEVRPVPEDRLPLDFLAFLADGRTVVTGVDGGMLRLWRLPRLEAMPVSMKWPKRMVWPSAAISPDGKILAWVDESDGDVYLRDIFSGKNLRRLPHKIGPWSCHFSPDGKLLLTRINQHLPQGGAFTGAFQLWDVESGKPVRRFEGNQGMPGFPAFSPDGKRLAVPGDNQRIIRIWDIDTGQMLRAISITDGRVTRLAFSADGRLLAGLARGEHPLRLWEVASGKEVRILHTVQVKEKHRNGADLFVLTPDNRRMIVPDLEGNLFCWNIRTGILEQQWQAHASGVMPLDISTDNQTLLSGDGTTALAWNLAELLPKEKSEGGELSPAEMRACWADLKADDATQAYRAVWRLADAKAEAVSLLLERLRPAREPDKGNTERIVKLIADLDDDAFAVREKASRELKVFGRESEPWLRKALASGPSAESKRRIEELLPNMPESPPAPPPEQLRQLRALAVLEYAATPQAKKCLQMLAGGVADARLTREAKAALERLTHRPHTAP